MCLDVCPTRCRSLTPGAKGHLTHIQGRRRVVSGAGRVQPQGPCFYPKEACPRSIEPCLVGVLPPGHHDERRRHECVRSPRSPAMSSVPGTSSTQRMSSSAGSLPRLPSSCGESTSRSSHPMWMQATS
ncbi:hypothetical protein FM106_08785 [Brachybacterium faecium]|nr:hypothetical protein FM106_08785 [Brachybacterium faecium]